MLAGCAKESRWPSDVKPGVEVRINRVTNGKVIQVDNEWLTLEVMRSGQKTEVRMPREQVLEIEVSK